MRHAPIIFPTVLWSTVTRARVVLSSLVLTCAFPLASPAQEFYEDPEDLFYSELDEGGTLGNAMDIVAGKAGHAVAIDIAIYLCAPDPVAICEKSVVWDVWQDFLYRLDDNPVVFQVTQDMVDDGWDSFLVTGIGVYWCSPDPGYGCLENDRFSAAWLSFDSAMERNPNPADAISRISAVDEMVGELIAASVCGEKTCFAREIEKYYADGITSQPQELVTRSDANRKARPASSAFSFKGGDLKEKRNAREGFCKFLGLIMACK